MKRRAIIGIAAFYLLLSTGSYLCILSCGSNFLMHLFFTFVPYHEKQSEEKPQEDCKGEADCSCCEKHGKYQVKENIKPNLSSLVPQIPLFLFTSRYSSFLPGGDFLVPEQKWPEANAPPFTSGKHIYLKTGSLLI